jgi:hypothetical protein
MGEVRLRLVQILLGPFGCGDVHQRPNKFQLVRPTSDGMSHNTEMSDGPIRHQQPMLKREMLPVGDCAVDCPLHEREIFRMNALKDHVEGGGNCLVVSKNSETLI